MITEHTWRVVRADDGNPHSLATVVDEHDRSLLAVHNGTPTFRTPEYAEKIADMLNDEQPFEYILYAEEHGVLEGPSTDLREIEQYKEEHDNYSRHPATIARRRVQDDWDPLP